MLWVRAARRRPSVAQLHMSEGGVAAAGLLLAAGRGRLCFEREECAAGVLHTCSKDHNTDSREQGRQGGTMLSFEQHTHALNTAT